MKKTIKSDATFDFPFAQRYAGPMPVCSCCHTTVASGAPRDIRADHIVHKECAAQFDKVEHAKGEFSSAFERMPKDFFVGSQVREHLARVCTYEGLRLVLRGLVDLLREKKRLLRQMAKAKYAEVVELLRVAAERIRLGHLVVSALAE